MSVELKGSVEIGYTVRGLWALSKLTEGWTDEEKQALIDGDDMARSELISAHWALTREHPEECDEDWVDIRGLPERAKG